MITWIERELVLAIHDRQLAEYGGAEGVRDEGLLQSALAKPRQLHAYGDPAPDLADLAAALAFGLARNHPFVDANKRTASVTCETFIDLNDARLAVDDDDWYLVILALAGGHLSAADFAAWLRVHLRPQQVHEEPARYRRRTAKAR